MEKPASIKLLANSLREGKQLEIEIWDGSHCIRTEYLKDGESVEYYPLPWFQITIKEADIT